MTYFIYILIMKDHDLWTGTGKLFRVSGVGLDAMDIPWIPAPVQCDTFTTHILAAMMLQVINR